MRVCVMWGRIVLTDLRGFVPVARERVLSGPVVSNVCRDRTLHAPNGRVYRWTYHRHSKSFTVRFVCSFIPLPQLRSHHRSQC